MRQRVVDLLSFEDVLRITMGHYHKYFVDSGPLDNFMAKEQFNASLMILLRCFLIWHAICQTHP